MATGNNLLHICLADDDDDDCLLFEDVLKEVDASAKLTIASNGVQLMEMLKRSDRSQFPHVLFLDLNMPLKDGINCLSEIKQDKELSHLPIIIFSTSAQEDAVEVAYQKGAAFFFKKPDSFTKLKVLLKKILGANEKRKFSRPSRKEFLIDF